MSRSREDLIRAVLETLKVVGEGDPVEAGDGKLVGDRIDTTLATLAGRDIVSVNTDDGIPDEYFDPLTSVIAAIPALIQRYGIVGEQRTALMQDGQLGERDLLRVQRGGYQGYVQQADYF